MRLAFLFAVATSLCQAATCTSQGVTPQPSNSTGTWNCGHVPLSTDDVVVATPVVLTGDLTGNTIKYHGATARLSTDGTGPHLVKSFSSGAGQSVEFGCSSVSTACVSPYIIDTCLNSSAGNEVTFTATGLSNGGYVFTHFVDSISPFASVQVNLCHSIIAGGNGGALAHEGAFASLDTSTWNIATSKFTGTGKQIQSQALGNIALSNVSWDGGVDYLFRVSSADPTTCSFVNLTITGNSTAGINMFNDSVGNSPSCVSDGYAFKTSVPNSGAGSLISVSNSILKSTFTDPMVFHTQDGITLGGTSMQTAIAVHNAVDGFYHGISMFSFSSSSGNFLVQNNGTALGQGVIFIDGPNCPTSSDHDILTVDDDPFVGESTLALGTGPGTPACAVYSNDTMYQGILHGIGGTETVALGENDGMGGDFPIINSAFFDSIVVTGNAGIRNRDMDNVFLTNGTGGVGVYNNDVYNPNSPDPAYFNPFSSSHFDNGVTPHPNAIYGDIIQQNPIFADITKRFPQCDAQLGGTGTLINMFNTVMFNRWTGVPPIYTPSQVVDCLRAGWAPKNFTLGTASSTGSFIGALPPAVSPLPGPGVSVGSAIQSGVQ